MSPFSRRSRLSGERTRIFFATDLHSSEACFRKLLATPTAYDVQALIMGGDCTGKMLIPLVEIEPGTFRCDWAGETTVLRSPEQVAEQEKRIRYSGLYPVRLGVEEAQALERDSAEVEALFLEQMCQTLSDWMVLAKERLRDTGVHMIVTPGNDDAFAVDAVLAKCSFVDAAEGRLTHIGSHEMLSVGWSNHTPWDTPRECSEEALAAMIDALAVQIENMDNAIFNIHVPPYGTGLDEAPELDDELRPVQGGTVISAVGSTAVRDTILKYQPLLGLHGHIHESRGVQKLGRTTCINPGSAYGQWILQGVVVELGRGGDIESYTLTSG
jgi:Icc-related predicted phosphoesterase